MNNLKFLPLNSLFSEKSSLCNKTENIGRIFWKISSGISMILWWLRRCLLELITCKEVQSKLLIMSQKAPVSNANCRTEDQANLSQQNQYTCLCCSRRTFSTYRGLSQHNCHCTKRLNVVSISSSQSVTISGRAEVTNVFSPVTSLGWGERDGTLFTDDLNEAYEKIVFWSKNIFMLPTRNAGKKCIRLLNTWT